jgi:hypothetical protein
MATTGFVGEQTRPRFSTQASHASMVQSWCRPARETLELEDRWCAPRKDQEMAFATEDQLLRHLELAAGRLMPHHISPGHHRHARLEATTENRGVSIAHRVTGCQRCLLGSRRDYGRLRRRDPRAFHDRAPAVFGRSPPATGSGWATSRLPGGGLRPRLREVANPAAPASSHLLRPGRQRLCESRRYLDLGKESLRIHVVLSGFVHHAHHSSSLCFVIREGNVDLSHLERCRVALVGQTDEVTDASRRGLSATG